MKWGFAASNRLKPRLIKGAILLVAVAAALVAADWWVALPAGLESRYVGWQTCADCHSEQTQRWLGSDHDRAMDLATAETVLGNFDDRELTHHGTRSRMSRRGDQFLISTEGPNGREETFRIKYTLGVQPLQQYMVEFDDGRVQVLPVAWNTERHRWFHLYPDQDIAPDDWLHWTRPGQTWNDMCADCHSTNVQKNYDPSSDTYRTTFSEIDVSCEACHGPGSLHVQLAQSRSLFWDRRHGTGLAKLKDSDPDVEIETCAKCHARRQIIEEGFRSGNEFLDYYAPVLLDTDLYHPDGQIREEVYEYGSFLQSRMYREGVRCSDCHDPHTAELRTHGNDLCTRCHTPGRYDAPAHHHHPVGSQGSLCVECHMPAKTYMLVDPRRDHSLRVPRPDLTVTLGTPNACGQCHQDQPPQWAADWIVQWYGPKRPDNPHYGPVLAAGRAGGPDAADQLITLSRRKDVGPVVRASALMLLARYPGTASWSACQAALSDPEPLIRFAAVRALEGLPPEAMAIIVAPLLDDPVRLVRAEAGRVLSKASPALFEPGRQPSLARAVAEYERSQILANDQAAYLNLGILYGTLEHFDQAERAYRRSIAIDPLFVPPRLNLAMLYAQQHDRPPPETERLLREAIALAPKSPEAHYNLGLLLAEDEQRLAEAADELAEAARLSHRHARIQYNYGLALQRLDRPEEAEQHLLAAYELQPREPDFLYALAVLSAQQKRWSEAREWTQRLLRLQPGDGRAQALLRHLQQHAP